MADEEFTLSLVETEPRQRNSKRDQRRKQNIKDDFYHAPNQVGSGYHTDGGSVKHTDSVANADDLLDDSWGEDTWGQAWDTTIDHGSNNQLDENRTPSAESISDGDVDTLLAELQYANAWVSLWCTFLKSTIIHDAQDNV